MIKPASRRVVAWISTLAVAFSPAGVAFAAKPTTSECLAASHASLQLGNEHKLRAQRAQLLVCASPSCPAEIRRDCLSQVDELKAEIPTIIFAAKDPVGADTSAVSVRMDGETLAEQLDGVALAVDPGLHVFTFAMTGQPTVTKTFVIQESQRDRREVVSFASKAAGVALESPPSSSSAVPGEASPHALGLQKVLAIVAGGIGIAGLGVGTAFGIVALSEKSSAQAACPASECATTAGSSKWSDAATSGDVSTAALIVGGVGVAGAALLWFTAPSFRGGARPQVGIGPAAIQVRGTW